MCYLFSIMIKKCEDQSLLPVAFMDMNMYVTVAKNLNGMILFGDFMKSASFVGFTVCKLLYKQQKIFLMNVTNLLAGIGRAI